MGQRARLFGMTTTKNSKEYTAEALKTFFLHTKLRPDDQFVLIDNDNSWTNADSLNLSVVDILKNAQPLSFAANGNQLIDRAKAASRDLFILNNDLIFTPGWDQAMERFELAICCPLSNREVQYAVAIQTVSSKSNPKLLTTGTEMNLSAYYGSEHLIQAIAETHLQGNRQGSSLRVLIMPFFCVRLPLEVMTKVGHFDLNFGLGGGEDYDYSLRAYLAGFESCYALDSWLVHFYGKSSWSGVESAEQRSAREAKFMSYFESKWGGKIRELAFSDDRDLIKKMGYEIPRTIEDFANLISALKAN